MSGLFSAPSAPPPPPPPPLPPAPADASPSTVAEGQDAAVQERLRRARAAGRSANILTGGQGLAEPLQTTRKRLLGE